MRSPPRPRRDRARVGARPVRDSERAARLTPPPYISVTPRRGAGRRHGRNPSGWRTGRSRRPWHSLCGLRPTSSLLPGSGADGYGCRRWRRPVPNAVGHRVPLRPRRSAI
jgi:hypothetical protein